MDTSPAEIRCVLIHVDQTWLLLPNASVAEVLSFAVPDAVDGAPDWLLGRIRWRGWRVPLVAFAPMTGLSGAEGIGGNRVVVLKALGGNEAQPHIALATRGYPRLVSVAESALEVIEDAHEGDLPAGVLARLRFQDEDVVVPDLDAIEARIREALPETA